MAQAEFSIFLEGEGREFKGALHDKRSTVGLQMSCMSKNYTKFKKSSSKGFSGCLDRGLKQLKMTNDPGGRI